MGFVTSEAGGLWLNVANGRMHYKIDGEPRRTRGYVGIITGVRVRARTFRTDTITVVDMMMRDDIDGANVVIISGTLFGATGQPTVFGKMLAVRLAHPDLRERKGRPVHFSVWTPKDHEPYARVTFTCCNFFDPETNKALGALDLVDVPPEEVRPRVERMLFDAVEHYGIIPVGDALRSGADTTAVPGAGDPTGAGDGGDAPFGNTDLPF